MRCLIIDDDESPRLLMERLIELAGHKATAVASCREAVKVMVQDGFDVAIVDMEMPGQNGTDTIDALRGIDPQLRVLVVSGHGDRRHVMAALQAGADGYILKDDLSDSLAASLIDVRAGNTPLSPRVATIMLNQLRQALGSHVVATRPVARIKRN